MQEPDALLKKLRVSRVQSVSPEAVTLTLEPISWEPHHRSGQFITLVFNTPHGEKRRSYSISSNPGEPLQITVKKIDNGEFSRPLNYKTVKGDELLTTGIAGTFVLPEDPSAHDYLFIAAGSGIIPCLPMIREILQRTGRRVGLIYSNKTRATALFIEALEQLAKTYNDRFTLYLLFSDSSRIEKRRLSKWLLDDLLVKMAPAAEQTLYYLCGPFEFMQMCRIAILTRAGKRLLRTESFDHSPRRIFPKPPDLGPHDVVVHVSDRVFKFTVQFPVPVTKAAAAQGIHLPYSCEAGRCASCAATVTKGKMWMAHNEVLTDKEVAAGRVLACQGFPVGGDAEIRFE